MVGVRLCVLNDLLGPCMENNAEEEGPGPLCQGLARAGPYKGRFAYRATNDEFSAEGLGFGVYGPGLKVEGLGSGI